ncbi:hypothetical protein CPAV1605_85 [seawater metagenome]|uniref:Uncharacterized protein n=1 Tax=seawater metagenome TaxID=1561972 RepID=A0A5E8CFY8_9ZZZZ
MSKIIFSFFAVISQVIAAPPINNCCLDHPQKEVYPTFIGNYDCSQLTDFGKTRCNEVLTGKTCIWKTGRRCKNNELKVCKRIPKYEVHYNKAIDVGKCIGLCKDETTICSPSKYVMEEIDTDISKKVRIIKDCDCENCGVKEEMQMIEIPKGKCFGNCNQKQYNKVCVAGLNDGFDTTNLENSSPSTLLLSGILSQCSAGVQSGFDIFIDNRCFGHTITNCLTRGPCDLKKAILHICIQAAQVSLTNTDSIILGTNGQSLWGRNLGILNGGSWNPGDSMCLDLDLDNLPGGGSILNNIDSIGHLDVVVQDDSAVDFVRLNIQYEKCLDCIPGKSTLNTLYTLNGVQEFEHITDCDCVNATKCHRTEFLQTLYPGTIYEQTHDIGQCIGGCDKGLTCRENKDENKVIQIKTPHGPRELTLINSCFCEKLTWNEHIHKE